ncbi:MAG: leucine-rich repeat domain-containing protein [Pirellulales bacterium]
MLLGAPKLRHLTFSQTSISDLSPLSSLTSLETVQFDGLNLYGPGVNSLSPLGELKNLKNLSLDHSLQQFVDLTPLAQLTKLKSLNLSGNHIIDVAALSGLSSLDRLYLADNHIRDIQSLTNAIVLDDSQQFSNNGQNNVVLGPKWTPSSETTSFAGGQHVAVAGSTQNNTDTVSFDFPNLPKGTYDVQVTWSADENLSHQVAVTRNQQTPAIVANELFKTAPATISPVLSSFSTVIIDTDALTAGTLVAGDDNLATSIFGTPFTFSVKTVTLDPTTSGQVLELVVHGDLAIGAGNIVIKGSRPLSLIVENDVYIADGATIDASAVGVIPGPGGGAPSTVVGLGGTGGSGGSGGTPGGSGGEISSPFGKKGNNGAAGLPGLISEFVSFPIQGGFNTYSYSGFSFGNGYSSSGAGGFHNGSGGVPGAANEPGGKGAPGGLGLDAPDVYSGNINGFVNSPSPINYSKISGGIAGGRRRWCWWCWRRWRCKRARWRTRWQFNSGIGGNGGAGGVGGNGGNGGQGETGEVVLAVEHLRLSPRVWSLSEMPLKAKGGDGQVGSVGTAGAAGQLGSAVWSTTIG